MADFSLLKQYRDEVNESLDDVHDKTGISIGYLNRIERGHVTIIKNDKKRKALENYMNSVRQRAKSNVTKKMKLYAINQ